MIAGVIAAAGFTASNIAKSQAEARLKEVRSLALNLELSPCLGARAIQNPAECGHPFDVRNPRFTQLNGIDLYIQPIDTGKDCAIYHRTPDNQSDPSLYCEFGDINATQTIAILGDSHANHWINALNDIGKRNGIKLRLLSSGVCSWKQADDPACIQRTNFIRENSLLSDVSAVLVSVWYRYDANYSIQPTEIALSTAKSLTKAPVYLLEDIPPAGAQGGPDCINQGKQCKNSIDSLWAINSVRDRIIKNGFISSDHVISTKELFCDTAFCYSYIGGIPVYHSYGPKDDPSAIGGNSHMTATYSLTTSGMLEDRLRKQGALDPIHVQPTPTSSIINEDEKHSSTDPQRCAK